jgi:hypothetical protein
MEKLNINPSNVREKMSIPKELQKQHDLAVRAGLRLMFGEGMREETLSYMESGESMPQKIGEGIASVVQFIASESNGTFPGQLVIPVGVELIVHAVDVAEKAGVPIDNNDIAEGMAAFIEIVLQKSGATPEQMQSMLGGIDSNEKVV